MNDMDDKKDRLAAGDKVVHLTDPRLGRDALVAEEAVVERLTPTGIAVLSNGKRLSPEPHTWSDDTFWEARGTGSASAWRSPHRYYRAESELVAKARHAGRVLKTEIAIDKAFDQVRKERYSLESLDALNEAVSARLAFHVRGEK